MAVKKLERYVDSLFYVLGAAGAGTIAAGALNGSQNLYDKGLMMVTAVLGYVLGRSLPRAEENQPEVTLEDLEEIIHEKKVTSFNLDQMHVYKLVNESEDQPTIYCAELSCAQGVSPYGETMYRISTAVLDQLPVLDRVAHEIIEMTQYHSKNCRRRHFDELNLNYTPLYDSIIDNDGIVRTKRLDQQEQQDLETKLAEQFKVLKQRYKESIE